MSQAFQERFRDRVGAVGKQGELEVAKSTPVQKDSQQFHSASLQNTGVSVLQSVHQSHPSLPFPSFPQGDSTQQFQFARPIKIFRNVNIVKQDETVSAPRMTPVASSLLDGGPSIQASEVQSLQDYRQLAGKGKYVGFADLPRPINEATKVQKSQPASKPEKPQRSVTPFRAPPKPLPDKKSLSADALLKSPVVPPAGFSPYTLKDYRLIRPSKYVQLGGLGPYMVGTEEWLRKKDLHEKRRNYAMQVLATNMNRFTDEGSRFKPEKAESVPSNSRQRALDFARRVRPPIAKFQKVTVVLGSDDEDQREEARTSSQFV